MDLIDLLNSDELELPTTRQEGDFVAFLRGKFDTYLARLAALDPVPIGCTAVRDAIPQATQLANGIIASLNAYLQGQAEAAYTALDTALRGLGSSFQELCPANDMSAHFTRLYRLRRSDAFRLSRSDLWHIPFEVRQRVSAMRYSIPGVPCLYLGGSIYACWEEMGRPSLDSIHAARFKPTGTRAIRVVNFGHRPALLAAALQSEPAQATYVVGYTVSWPIIAACSVRALHGDSPFKIEYVMPQLLLQWARRNNFDGIRYFSTKIPAYISDPRAQVNYVFPAQSLARSGLCGILRQAFASSVAVSWQAAQVAPLPHGVNPPNNWPLELVEGQPTGYYSTRMGAFEASLDGLTLASP